MGTILTSDNRSFRPRQQKTLGSCYFAAFLCFEVYVPARRRMMAISSIAAAMATIHFR